MASPSLNGRSTSKAESSRPGAESNRPGAGLSRQLSTSLVALDDRRAPIVEGGTEDTKEGRRGSREAPEVSMGGSRRASVLRAAKVIVQGRGPGATRLSSMFG